MMQLITEDIGSVHDGVQDPCDPSKAEDAGNEVEPFLDEADDVVNLKFGELWLALEEGEPLRGRGRVQLVSTALDFDAGMFKTEVSYTYGVENLLEQLQGPLAIVHTVHPREVEENFEKWREVIVKEIGAIEHATVPLPEGSEVRERWLKQDKCQILPMKLVYTVKPRQGDDPRVQAEKFRRKARIVLCGNMADADAAEVYAATAPAEVVRATLIHAAKAKWQVAVLDITSAFLQTPLEAIQDAPVVVAAPPKILERQGLVAPRTLWGITHAVYGLRQSPKLWGAFRDMTVKDMAFDLEDGTYRLRQGRVENTWWSLEREGGGLVKAIMVIYVDDFLVAGDAITIEKVAEKIRQTWKASEAQIAKPDCPVRFLGMIIEVNHNGFNLSQEDYLDEMARVYDLKKEALSKIPLSKEGASFAVLGTDAEPEEKMTRAAQKLAGEVLWVSGRTRPDVAFPGALISSLATRAPSRAVEIGLKIVSYLVRTKDFRLQIYPDATGLSLYTDASFAPDSEKSHSGWVVLMAGAPLAWRSSRQTMVSLSTAEAELTAMLEGAVAFLGTEALLRDLSYEPQQKAIFVDSTSALALSEGSGSWRTRHLRVKAEWMCEKLTAGEFAVHHCEGRVQLADLLTKAMPWSRIREMLLLWGFDIGEELAVTMEAVVANTAVPSNSIRSSSSSTPSHTVATRVLAFIILMSCVTQGVGTGMELWSEPQPLRLDPALVSWAFLTMVAVLLITGWECVRWAGLRTIEQYGRGAAERRHRRLLRLREQTAATIEAELRQRPAAPEKRSLSQPQMRARDAIQSPEQQPGSKLSRRSAEGDRSSSMAAVTIGTMTVEEAVCTETREIGIQAELGFTYLPPAPTPTLRIETVPHPGPYYLSDHGNHVHLYQNCWGLRNAQVRSRQLCKCCEQNNGRSLSSSSSAR